MTNSRKKLIFPLAASLTAAVLLAGCSSAGDFGGLGGSTLPGADKKEETKDRQELSSDSSQAEDENEKADIPEQVSGAFLTCAFMDSKDDFMSETEANPGGTVGIGCGLFKSEDKKGTPKLIAIDQLKVRLRILMGKDQYADVPSNLMRQPASLHTISDLPVKYLASTIEIKVQDVGTKVAIFRKTIPSVRSFGARTAFDIVEDMNSQGLQLSSNGDVVPSAAPAATTFVRENSWYESLANTVKVTADVFKAIDEAQQAKDEKGTSIYQVAKSSTTVKAATSGTSTTAAAKTTSYEPPELKEETTENRRTNTATTTTTAKTATSTTTTKKGK